MQIRNIREKSGQTQAQVAEALGITPGAVAGWETGSWKPSIDNLMALSRHFDVSVDDLLADSPADPPATPVAPADSPAASPAPAEEGAL